MSARKPNSYINFLLAAVLVFFIVLLLLPSQSEQVGLKKPNQEPKPKKTFAFHKITHIPIKEDDDLDEDIKEFFEKVHHADIKTAQSQVYSDDDEEKEDIEEDKRRLSYGFFGWLFGFKKDDSDNREEQPVVNHVSEAEEIVDEESKTKSSRSSKNENIDRNGIINWLQSFAQSDESKKSQFKDSENIISEYFNRWPFNVVFPIGQSQKVVVPRSGDSKWRPGEPISDDDFESLLETFPSFIVNPNYVNDIDCKQQIQIFQRQLRGHKMWTLQMIDASGKITSGILRGNINQFGDFDMCTNIKTAVKVTKEVSVRIKGKYCLAHVEIQLANDDLKLAVHLLQGRGLWNSHLNDPLHFAPRYSIINWGICIPHACQPNVVRDMIDRSLQPYNRTGIYFHVEVDENDCYVRNSTHFQNLFKHNTNIGFTVGYFITFLSAVISSILIENRHIFKKIWRIFWGFLKPKLLQMKIELKDFIELAKKSHAEAKTELEAQIEKDKNKGKSDTINSETDGKSSETSETSNNVNKSIETTIEKSTVQSVEEIKAEEQLQNHEINEDDAVAVDENIFDEDSLDKSTSLFKDIILSFSPKRSFEILFNIEGPDTVFAIVHIIKIFCTFMLYVCLKYLMLGHLPVLNRDKLIKSLDTPISILYRSPFIYFDILLIVSGFTKAYQMCQEMEDKFYIYALKRIILKILRFLPSLYAVLLFQTWILPHLESGPLWNNIIGTQSQICEKSLWRNLFGVQNAIQFEETCSPMTIQHSVELQLYLLAPLVVWLFYCNSEIGFMVYGGIHMMSVAVRYSRTNTEHLSPIIFHGMHVSKFYRTANLLFSSPLPRATAFLIGIGTGILYKTSKNDWKNISKIGLTFGWITALVSLIYCYWYPLAAVHLDYIYNPIDAASYASWSPLILGFTVTWIIFIIPAGTTDKEKTPLYRLLTSRPILFLGRITYPTQLVLYVAVLYFTAQQKEARPYSINDLINFGEITVILLYAAILAVFIDIPMQRVSKLVVNQVFPDRAPLIVNLEDATEEQNVSINNDNEQEISYESRSTQEYDAKDGFVAGGVWGEENQSLTEREDPIQDTKAQLKADEEIQEEVQTTVEEDKSKNEEQSESNETIENSEDDISS